MRPSAFCLALLPLSVAAFPQWIPSIVGNNASASPGGVLGGCSGQIFGFSGLDGDTDEISDFVGVFSNPGSFTLRFCRLAGAPVLTVSPPSMANAAVEVATNDVLVVNTDAHSSQPSPFPTTLSMAWVSGAVLAGSVPPSSTVKLEGARVLSSQEDSTDCSVLAVQAKTGSALAFCSSVSTMAMTWQLAFVKTGGTAAAVALAKAPVPGGVGSAVAKRLAPYQTKSGLVPQVAGEWQQLLNKCVSVMRVNGLAAQGGIQQHWSTPDRVPHQWMWLWDSCYHSMSMNQLGVGAVTGTNMTGPQLAFEYLKSVLDAAGPDGAIAIERTPTSVGTKVTQTQPPLLAWAVHENYIAAIRDGATSAAEAVQRVKSALPALEGYLRWDMSHRADPTGGTPLLVWTRGTESGMDNSQRFDACSKSASRACKDLLSVDFSVFLAREAALVATMASITGNATKADEWASVAAKVEAAIHAVLYDEDRGLYFDRWASSSGSSSLGPGSFSDVEAVTGLLPLWLPNLPAERIAPLLAAINDPQRFGTPMPLPSVAARTAHFSTDMWRGPMWLNTNYMVALGLLSQSTTRKRLASACRAAALRIMEATVSVVRRDYEKYGVIFEFYDALDQSDPRTLLRKGAHSGGVRDYHWSAALTLKMLVFLNETAYPAADSA